LPLAHRTFLANAVGTLGVDVKFAVLFKQFDLHTGPRLDPGLGQQGFLQTRQTAFRCSHQIPHRRVAGTHLGQHRFRRNTAIHDPHPPGPAVLLLDLGQEHPQRRAIGRVAGQHLVGQRQPVRCHHQRDPHVRTVQPLVAAVAVPTFVALGHVGSVDLEIGAGEIVEQHVELGIEQVTPACHQVGEQICFVGQQKIVTGIEFVRFGQSEVRTQQVSHRRAAKPFAVQFPLAARRNEPIAGQHLQNLIPTRAFAASRQAI
jgi:hypothetical protein